MLREAAAVVIGSGALGCSVAYHLAKSSVAPVALIDKHEIASQTSPRAAGLSSELRKSELMTRLAVMGVEKIKGFAAETGDLLRKAREKRVRKNIDLIVANDVTTPGAGFEVETNAVTIIGADQEQTLPLQSKTQVAEAILDRVEQLLKRRPAAINS